MSTALPLQAAAERVGGYRWMEDRLFALSGRWSVEPTVPAVQLFLDDASVRHGRHARLWEDRLPVLDWLDPEELTRPYGPVVAPLLEAVRRLGDDPPAPASTGEDREECAQRQSIARLSALCKVVWPHLLASFAQHLARTAVVADRPIIRVLHVASEDLRALRAVGEDLLARWFAAPAQVELAAAVQELLEERLAGAGLFDWPELAAEG